MSQRRHALLQRHRELACLAYERAMDNGVDSPVVWVLDLEDREGRSLAVAFESKESACTMEEAANRIDARAVEIAGRNAIPALVLVFPRAASLVVASRMTDGGRQAIDQLVSQQRNRRVPVVVVGDGGNTYASIPLP